jgi:3-hydroxybutyryl-CoA dehydrogenase
LVRHNESLITYEGDREMTVSDIRKVSVIGAGLMGHGIAQEFALAGYEVGLHDLSEEKLQRAVVSMQTNLEFLSANDLMTETQPEGALNNIHCSTVLREVAFEADVVIEAVFEDLDLKREVFAALDRECPERTILASNTSTLLPSLLASATQRPDKILVAHYFNPPYLLPLVEVVRGKETSDETVTTLRELLMKVGKKPAIVQKETPGFVANRLQAALLREALSIVRKGIATPQDVDTVVKNSFGRRLATTGVFEVFEIAGWDLVLAAASNLLDHLDSSPEVSPLLKERVEQGELGIKTGRGFYEWTPASAAVLQQRMARGLVKIAQLS